MRSLLFQSAIITLLSAVTSSELIDGTNLVGSSSVQPAVAFVCGKPAMYLTQSGWQRDDNQVCLKANEDILNYCKDRYPGVEIVNIVPHPSEVTIGSWCNSGQTGDCENATLPAEDQYPDYDGAYDEFYGMNTSELEQIHRRTVFTVRPYRCLVAPFQADALMIPESCKFSHIDTFDSDNCSSYVAWNTTATQQCAKTKLTLYSVAVLLPCSQPGNYAGAEFVCCPPVRTTSPDTVKDNVANASADADADTLADTDITDENAADEDNNAEDDGDEASEEVDDCFAEVDYNRVYETSPSALGRTEHERYEKARRCVSAFYASRKEALIRGVTESRSNITDATSRLEADATFRRAYGELDAQWVHTRREMNALHQRRVQDELAMQSAAALGALNAELDDVASNDPHADLKQISRIITAMKKFISRLRKEEMHWVDRYEFLQEHHPEQLAATREQIRGFIFEIQSRLNRTFDLLKRVPEFEAAVRERIAQFLTENGDVDYEVKMLFPEGLAPAAIRAAVTNPATAPSSTASPQSITALPIQAVISPDTLDSMDDEDEADLLDDTSESDEMDSTVLGSAQVDDMEVEPELDDFILDAANETSTRLIELDLSIDESEEDDSAIELSDAVQPMVLRAAIEPHTEAIVVNSITRVNWSQVLLLGTCIVAAIFTITLVTLLIRRSARARRALRMKPQTSVIDSDSQGLLESEVERGYLGNMQVNGYENPTYTLYSKKSEQ